ncbi:MAG TPA: beta-ketoacyl-ACP reductase [Propionibacteriaceae bacterium]|nr:beta-ketoacyl-ACP reductase [Propionibacteriaceae bacterium]
MSTASDITATDDPGPTPGRVVLVTGASKGIGRGIAAALHAAGYRVAGTYRSGDVPPGVLGVACDITDPAQVEAAFSTVEAEFGPVEILVANAGITRDNLLMRMSDDDWAAVVDTNLTGTFRLIKRATRTMMRKRFGRIVLVGSVVGLLGSPGQVNYAASKAGLVGIARSVARELGGRGITCNVVAPGFVETDMTAVLPEDTIAGYLQRIPAGRLGSVGDIAAAVAFLASDAAGYVNGAVIPVDGGLGMGH